MATKNEMLVCNVNAESITFDHKVRNDKGDFEVKAQYTFENSKVPDSLVDGDGFASMKSYGIRAFMSDRTSQLREHGIPAVIEGMQEVYNDLLCKGLYRAKRASKAGGVNRLLIAAVAEAKGLTVAVAEASLAKLTKEVRDQIAANEAIKAIMTRLSSERAQVETIELDDLIVTTEGDKK